MSMTEFFNWIAMIEIPIFIALFRMFIKQKKDMDFDLHKYRDDFAEFKLYVARNYVSNAYLKDVESRLTHHLLRIEKKLDDVSGGRR